MSRVKCPECGTVSEPAGPPGGVVPCTECGAKLRMPAGAVATAPRPRPQPGPPPAWVPLRYRALRVIAALLLLAALLCGVVAGITVFRLIELLATHKAPELVAGVVLYWAGAWLLLSLFCAAAAHTIKLFLDIEENTRRQAIVLEKLLERGGGKK